MLGIVIGLLEPEKVLLMKLPWGVEIQLHKNVFTPKNISLGDLEGNR